MYCPFQRWLPTSVHVPKGYHEKTREIGGKEYRGGQFIHKGSFVLYWQGLKCIGVKAESEAKWKERG